MEQHNQRAHAVLSASGSSRWLNCTPSARAEEGFPDTTSDYAEEGTIAHELSEATLRFRLKLISKAEFWELVGGLEKKRLFRIEMLKEVEPYVEFVLKRYKAAKRRSKSALVLLEERVDLTDYIPEGFGSCDAVIVADGILDVIDLKFGKGVRVEAEDNTQLMLYALGALAKFDLMFDIHTVQMTIVQPRLDHISTAKINVGGLYNWGDSIVKPKADTAFSGDGERCVGDWCRFCKAQATCKAKAEDALALTKLDFAPEQTTKEKFDSLELSELFAKAGKLTDEELLSVFAKSDAILKWVTAVKDQVLKEALGGKKFEGYKLVAGRSTRRWSAPEEVEAALIGTLGAHPAQIYSPQKLLGIPAIEKLLSKDDFAEHVAPFVIKPEGKPTLVPESDKRKELNDVTEDFK